MDESLELKEASPEEQKSRFFLLWTLKEAHGKMLGEGIARGALTWKVPVIGSVREDGSFTHTADGVRGYAVAHVEGLTVAVAAEPAIPEASLKQLFFTDEFSHDCLPRKPHAAD